MVYCLQALLKFAVAARRDAVIADIQSRIAGRARWSLDVLEAVDSKEGLPSIAVELRFISRADQEDLQARVETFASGSRAPESGSWLSLHDCNHDEIEVVPCTLIAERVW